MGVHANGISAVVAPQQVDRCQTSFIEENVVPGGSVDGLNAAAAIVTVASFMLAVWQFLAPRRAKTTEREKIAQQRERLSNAASAAVAGAEAADLIVQRSKEPSVTLAELQNIARVARMNLTLLHSQLEEEQALLSGWQYGRLTISSPGPAAVSPSGAGSRTNP